jgi:hypothetical protein
MESKIPVDRSEGEILYHANEFWILAEECVKGSGEPNLSTSIFQRLTTNTRRIGMSVEN